MKKFSIFPHKGYLNTDFQIKVFDNESHTFYYDENCHIENLNSFRLPAGKHQIKSDPLDDEWDEVEVEDAIRLGGSKVEAGYCFDNSPWVVAVMKDRTYFLNSNNGTQYVENGISPLKITALKNNLLLFEYGNKNESGSPQVEEYAVFNAAQGRIEKSFDKYVFHTSDMALFTGKPTEDGVCLHIMYFDDDVRILDIQCISYSVFEEEVYYCAINDDKFKIMKLQSDGSSVEVPNCNGYKNGFVGFTLKHYYVHRYYGCYYLKDILNPSNYTGVKIDDHRGIVRDIDGMRFENINYSEEFHSLVNSNKEVCSKLNLQVHLVDYKLYENNNEIYGRATHYFYPWQTIEKKQSDVSCEFGLLGNKTNITIDQWDKIIKAKGFIVVYNSEKAIVMQDGKYVRELEKISIRKTPQGNLIYYKDDRFDVRWVYEMGAKEDKLLVKGGTDTINLTFAEKYGILTENANQYRIFHIDEGRWVKMLHHKYLLLEKNGKCFLDDCDKEGQSYLLTATANPIALPVNVSKILSISPNGSSILSESPRGIILHEKYSSDSTYEINEKLIDAIDTSDYRLALFSEDGNHTTYIKNGAWYYYNTETEKEVQFEMTPEVLKCQWKGMYGMNFYTRFDESSRRVELIDPISLQRIAPTFLSEYVFVSPSGKLASKTHGADVLTKYFLSNRKKTSKEIDFNIEVSNLISTKEVMDIFLDGCHKCKDPIELFSLKRLSESMHRWNNHTLEQRIQHLEFRNTGTDKEDWEKGMINIIADKLGKKEEKYDSFCLYVERYTIINVFSTEKEDDVIQIELPVRLGYLNSIVFSPDDKYVSICGKPTKYNNLYGGFIGVYDLQRKEWVYQSSFNNKAIWKSFFSSMGTFAYYDSNPHAMYGNFGEGELNKVERRSILTFSRSGNYIAMSDKGYVPYAFNPSNWGHMKSANIYVRKVGNEKELRFTDHGDEIMNLYRKDVTCVSFSPDDKKLMSVSQDGVIIIRNLHLEELEPNSETKSQRSEIEDFLQKQGDSYDADVWEELTEKYFLKNDIYYSRDKKKLIACCNDSIKEYNVMDGCESICDDAFCPCIPSKQAVEYALETETEIPYGNFISIITIPLSVNHIGEKAFSYCDNLKEIRIPKGYMEKYRRLISSQHWDKLIEV